MDRDHVGSAEIDLTAAEPDLDLRIRRRMASRRLLDDQIHAFGNVVRELDANALEDAVERLEQARSDGSTVFIAGNGGSAATATHFASDLGKTARIPDRPAFRVLSLSDNTSWLTALGNDESYDAVFSGQLENFARVGDVLIVISASGNSPNLLRAVEVARAQRVFTMGLLGFDGGALKDMVDLVVWVPTEKGAYGLVESAHSLMAHLITACLAQRVDAAVRPG